MITKTGTIVNVIKCAGRTPRTFVLFAADEGDRHSLLVDAASATTTRKEFGNNAGAGPSNIRANVTFEAAGKFDKVVKIERI